MLYGSLNDIEWLKGNKALYAALRFLRDRAAAEPDGRHDLEDGVFVTSRHFEPQPRDMRRYEAHIRYADIQCVLEGDETIYVRPPEGLAVEEDKLAGSDVVLYARPADGAPEQDFVMRPGHFLVLCPEDAHKPECLTSAAKGRKAVAKIPVTLLK